MEERISGFKVTGEWGDAVEHGERVTSALRESGVDGDDFEEWDAWRPKAHERIDDEVNEKTAIQASVNEGDGEKAGKRAEDDIQSAGERLTESYERLEENDPEGAVDTWQDSVEYVARAADTAGRKALRRVENTVYRNVMTQLAPYYFDNELVSANLQRSTRGGTERFIFEVNVNDDKLKVAVSDLLGEYEAVVDRWHVDVEKATETAAAAEGVEVPENGGNAESTTN